MDNFNEIYNYSSGEMSIADEEIFFRELSINQSLRDEFRNYNRIIKPIRESNLMVQADSNSKVAIFDKLGLDMVTTPIELPAIGSKFILKSWLTYSLVFTFSALTGIIIYLIMLQHYGNQQDIAFQNANYQSKWLSQSFSQFLNNQSNYPNLFQHQSLESSNTKKSAYNVTEKKTNSTTQDGKNSISQSQYQSAEKFRFADIDERKNIESNESSNFSAQMIDRHLSVSNTFNKIALPINILRKRELFASLSESDYAMSEMSSHLDKSLTFEFGGVSDFFEIQPKTVPDNASLLQNTSISIMTSIYGNLDGGINLSNENFSLKYKEIDDGIAYWYYQQPNYYTLSLALRYSLPLFENNLELISQAMGGMNRTSPVVRAGIGLIFKPYSNINFMLMATNSWMIYDNQGVNYTASKYGISYGVIWIP